MMILQYVFYFVFCIESFKSLCHQFLQGLLQQRNDLYLYELRERLEDVCGIAVNEATVWRALHRSGFRMKRVRIHLLLKFCS